MVVPSRAEAPTDGTELRFQRLLENAQDLIYRFRVAPPRGYDYINSACLPMTGHAAAEFYADPQLILKIVHPDDLPLVTEAFQNDPEKVQRAVLLRRGGFVAAGCAGCPGCAACAGAASGTSAGAAASFWPDSTARSRARDSWIG